MAAIYYTLTIYPYPLINLKVKVSDISHYVEVIDNGTNYTAELADGLSYIISADGYKSQTIQAMDQTITLISNTPDISKLSNGTDTYNIRDDVAREAINNLATVATSGSYNDLSNKPTIPAAQVNSDWNATSGVAQILNKPTIPTVPTNVSAFTNDSGYITSSALTGYATQAWVGQQGYITSSALNGYATESYVDNGLDGKVDKNDLAPVHCVIETYANGTSWYRVYDDGWIEQGGRGKNAAATTQTTVTFIKPFTNANSYKFFAQHIGSSNAGTITTHEQATTTNIKVNYSQSYSGGSRAFDWIAFGY